MEPQLLKTRIHPAAGCPRAMAPAAGQDPGARNRLWKPWLQASGQVVSASDCEVVLNRFQVAGCVWVMGSSLKIQTCGRAASSAK
ncbi:hypothetical protein RCH07_003048 [Arthrobacter sp. CG_A4]|nr:hypothetical protein [Arthrobacter sp. CG_A4]